MNEIISTYAPGVNEIFSAVDVAKKEKNVEFASKLFSSKSALSGLKTNEAVNDNEFAQTGDYTDTGVER